MKKMTINENLPKNLPLLLKEKVEKNGNIFLQADKNKNGDYEYFTYSEVYEKILAFSLSLEKIGMKRGENVAIISDNRNEWLVSDMAIQSLGGADVPRGTDSSAVEIRFIINFADCKIGIFENEKQILKVLENISEVPLLKTVILYTEISEETKQKIENAKMNFYYFKELLADGEKILKSNYAKNKNHIEEKMYKTQKDDVATIIFTSGTTGTPKGVMLTHNNYLSQLSVAHNFMPGKMGEWWMSILPIWHSFERIAQYEAILLHCGIAYSKPNARVLLSDLKTIKPRWMCGVPRLWDALSSGINKKMAKEGKITYSIYKFFMNIGKNYANAKDFVIGNVVHEKKYSKIKDFFKGFFPFLALFPLHKLGNALVYKKIKSAFGGNLVFAISGGGALQNSTDDFFRAINLTMLEGYGMTETSPVIAFRDYRHPQKNCVGTIFPTIQVKIAKENHGIIEKGNFLPNGEKGMIMVKGPHVMKGYYKRPDLTSQIIDSDGWLNTGDLGMIASTGELKITGRAKDTIVLLDGENIEPALIEKELCSSDFIESAVVVGQDKKYLSSLIVPSKSAIIQYAKENQINYENYENLIQNEKITKFISNLVEKLICTEHGFRSCEKIFKIALLSKSFEVGKELSAKQEVMRYKITEEYQSEIEKMYA